MTDSDNTMRDYESGKYDNLVIGRVIKSLGNSMFSFVYAIDDNGVQRVKIDIAKLKGKFTTKKAKRNSNVSVQTFIIVSLDSNGKDKHEIYGVYERKDIASLKLNSAVIATELDPHNLVSNSFEADDLFEASEEVDVGAL
jgi:hypothetical protein